MSFCLTFLKLESLEGEFRKLVQFSLGCLQGLKPQTSWTTSASLNDFLFNLKTPAEPKIGLQENARERNCIKSHFTAWQSSYMNYAICLRIFYLQFEFLSISRSSYDFQERGKLYVPEALNR